MAMNKKELALGDWQDKAKQLTTELAAALAERDEAVELLGEWCVRVKLVGTGWDDWDEGYKNAMYSPTRTPELRAALDAAIEKAKQKMKGEA